MWEITGEKLDDHLFVTCVAFYIFSKSWHGIGNADRILSMDTARLSQCSWSVIEKIRASIEIELRKCRGHEKYSFMKFFLEAGVE